MTTSILLVIFTLGAIIGSFLNVVALRYNTGLTISRGRSKCFSCSKELKWYELIPIFSYVYLQGKCKGCKTKISTQYPIVEFCTGLIFVLIAARQYSLWEVYGSFDHGLFYSLSFFAFYCVVFSILIVISVYDIKHKIIPDEFSYTFIVLSLLKLVLFYLCRKNMGLDFTYLDTLDFLAPLFMFLPFAMLWLVSGGRWIGFGDAKLAIGIGALLGFVSGVSAIVLSFWIGAVYGILMIIRGRFNIDPNKKLGMSSEVPFAPFMIIATIVVFITRIDVLGIGQLLSLLK